MGVLTVTPHRLEAEIVALGPSEGHRNPSRPQHVVVEHGHVSQASLTDMRSDPTSF